jgi:hypothetical protein
MEDYQQRWSQCLQLIREWLPKDINGAIKSDDAAWVYQTWFAPITFESFDPNTGQLILRIPDIHVRDYIEHYRMTIWSWALHKAFGDNTRLGYRVMSSASSQPEGYLRSTLPHERLHFTIPDARHRLQEELRRAIGPDFQWLSYPTPQGDLGYDKIAAWLQDNQGRGLLYVGTTGVGKSVMCCDVLPAIIGGKDSDKIPVVKAEDMRSRLDELKRARCVVIDDLGKDKRKYYGETDNSFFDLCEASIHGGPLLIIATSLSTTPVGPQHRQQFPLSIEERYGQEVLDRLSVICTATVYSGKSLRSK